MELFLPFFLVLLTALIFSAVFRQFHLPWVIALIVAGMVIGPHGAGVAMVNPTIDFIAQIGLVFLMFMAGLETQFSNFVSNIKRSRLIALTNSLIPLGAGFSLGLLFDLSFTASLLLGIVFMSSSIAVIIPSLESSGVLKTRLGKTILTATMLEDIASLLLLSVLFQTLTPSSTLPLWALYVLLYVAVMFARKMLPLLKDLFAAHDEIENTVFKRDVRVLITLLLGTVVAFELLGLHPIVSGFFAGLALSDALGNRELLEKVRTIGYGIFIPVFFVVVGIQTDISVLVTSSGALTLTVMVVLTAIAAKYISGYWGARWAGFESQEARLIGVATVPQLSTTLAAVFSGAALGLFDERLVAALVMLVMISTFIAPVLMRKIGVPEPEPAAK